MVQINFAQKSVTVKIVYYGPGMSGKTTNLEIIHQRAPEQSRGELTSISTDGDRTLFFDFMPLDLGTVAGMRTQFQIYTVPGQVYYNSTRKLVLQGVDGVIFVADSSASMVEENLESLRNLAENLSDYGRDIATTPMVIQYNKRDLPDAMSVAELERLLNPSGHLSFEAVANSGQGVFPTLKALAARVLETVHRESGAVAGPLAPRQAAAPKETPAAIARESATTPVLAQAPAPALPSSAPALPRVEPAAKLAAPAAAPAAAGPPPAAHPGPAQHLRMSSAPSMTEASLPGPTLVMRTPAIAEPPAPRASVPAPAQPSPAPAPVQARLAEQPAVPEPESRPRSAALRPALPTPPAAQPAARIRPRTPVLATPARRGNGGGLRTFILVTLAMAVGVLIGGLVFQVL